MDARRLYVMGVSYEDGERAAVYERQLSWFTYEEHARRYFDRESANFAGNRHALICNGLVLAESR